MKITPLCGKRDVTSSNLGDDSITVNGNADAITLDFGTGMAPP